MGSPTFQVPGSLVKGRMEGALLTAIGEKTSPWDVKATSAVTITALQVSTAWGREDGPRIYTEAWVEDEGL